MSTEADLVSLRDYFERIIQDQDKRVAAAQTAAKEAVEKAEQAQERRLDLLNEFRAQAGDEARKYAQKEVVEPRIGALETAIQRAYGGLIVLGAIGVANLVKVWTG